MKLPPLYLTAFLILWGAGTDHLIPALVMAAGIELSNIIQRRWDMSRRDINRVSNFCLLLLIGGLIYYIAGVEVKRPLISLLQQLPLVFAPLVFVYLYSTRRELTLLELFRLRVGPVHPVSTPLLRFDPVYVYAFIVLLAASAGHSNRYLFFSGMAVLTAWSLYLRRRLRPNVVWAVLLIVTLTAAFGLQEGIYRGYHRLRAHFNEMLTRMVRQRYRLHRSRQALGTVHDRKGKGGIIMRVKLSFPYREPVYLRGRTYNRYHNGYWLLYKVPMRTVVPTGDGSRWILAGSSAADKGKRLTVSLPMGKSRRHLPLPPAAQRLRNLPVTYLGRNRLGDVEAENGPPLAEYRVLFGRTDQLRGSPTYSDLWVGPAQRQVFGPVAAHLNGGDAADTVRRVESFFQRDFRYTLDPVETTGRRSPLDTFLNIRRAADCEYFATATVLLLRLNGVPARYVTGYMAHDYSRMEQRFVVRRRDAHAWCEAWVNGRWRLIDTTPAVWLSAVAADDGIERRVADMASFVFYRLARWWWNHGSAAVKDYLWLLIIPLSLILLFRLYFRKAARKLDHAKRSRRGSEGGRGSKSPFYAVLARLEARYGRRPQGMPLARWLDELEENGAPEAVPARDHLLPLHYRCRFAALSGTDEQALYTAMKETIRSTHVLQKPARPGRIPVNR